MNTGAIRHSAFQAMVQWSVDDVVRSLYVARMPKASQLEYECTSYNFG